MPYLIVGLGGSGAQTAAHLKRILARRGMGPGEVRFVFIDTDETEYENLKKGAFHRDFEMNSKFIDPSTEWVNTAGMNPQDNFRRFVKEDSQHPFRRWLSVTCKPQN